MSFVTRRRARNGAPPGTLGRKPGIPPTTPRAGLGPAPQPGTGAWVARSIAYFKGNDATGPLLVLSA
jgi:hypothetical protein